jgi:hypothetical protein
MPAPFLPFRGSSPSCRLYELEAGLIFSNHLSNAGLQPQPNVSREPTRWGGLFRAATTFTEAATGAEKSLGHGGSPRGSRLRLAWSDCAYPKNDFSTRGRLKALSPFPVADSSETFPWVGNIELLRNLRRSYRQRL